MKLYSNGCPKCKVLKAKLEQKNISFEESDDLNFLIEKGFMSIPVLEVDGEFLDFASAVKYVNEM
jgi:glutaredoxin